MADDTSAPPGAPLDAGHLTRHQKQSGITSGAVTQSHEPVPLSAAVAELIDLSDYLDAQLRLRLSAYCEGYAAGERAHADDYDLGHRDGTMALKAAQHQAHGLTELDATRWALRGEARTRETFADPHPDDYMGGTLPLERPGQIWLAGPVVHYHECTPVCRSYKPGWYAAPGPQDGAA